MSSLNTDANETDTLVEIPSTVEELMIQSEVQRKIKSQPVYLKYFWKILLIVSAFYSLPSIQFVFFQYSDPSIQCYFNYKCARNFAGLTAFNNVLSNIFYITAGTAFLLITHFTAHKEDGVHGLHTDMSLYYCMGLTILLEGVFSALYHVCPSKLNFQFDTTFMLIGSGLLFFTVHQKRHATFTAGAFKAFSFFALFIFFNFLSLTNINAYVFWTLFFLLFGYISIVGSAYLLAHRRLVFNNSLSVIWFYIKKLRHPSQIDDRPRFITILIANVLSWGMVLANVILGFLSNIAKDFSNLILGVIILNFLVYLFYYIYMKFKHGEKVHFGIWILFIVMLVSWTVGLWFFEIPVTNKFLTFDESLKLNEPCVVFDYFDTHDVWHFFSAVGLFSIMSIVYFIDWDLRYVPRSLIHVF
ncbi:hypothetical protein CYY_005241 [Polysphondylium violaceum]|uniref:Transmembrane protein n=1 Tax=Polysphondylium violaceum TaxID=133409 RepID=A0A8J4USC4_9MYCE|nr:hypothetical protein CYY_005241 [Polysphondylium violaceum]